MKSLTFAVIFISLAFLFILAGCTRPNKSLKVEEGSSKIVRQHYIYYPIVDNNVKALLTKTNDWISDNKDKDVLSIQIVNADLRLGVFTSVTMPSGIVIFYK